MTDSSGRKVPTTPGIYVSRRLWAANDPAPYFARSSVGTWRRMFADFSGFPATRAAVEGDMEKFLPLEQISGHGTPTTEGPYEYGVALFGDVSDIICLSYWGREEAEARMDQEAGDLLARRRRAGGWEVMTND